MNPERIISLPETDQSFMEIVHVVEQYGSAVVALNNHPRYLVVELNWEEEMLEASYDEVMAVSKNLIRRNRAVYQELAK